MINFCLFTYTQTHIYIHVYTKKTKKMIIFILLFFCVKFSVVMKNEMKENEKGLKSIIITTINLLGIVFMTMMMKIIFCIIHTLLSYKENGHTAIEYVSSLS